MDNTKIEKFNEKFLIANIENLDENMDELIEIAKETIRTFFG